MNLRNQQGHSQLGHSQRGMTLTEIMIALAIGSVVIAGVSTVMSNMQKSVKGVEKSGDWLDLKTTIARSLSSEVKCADLLNLSALAINTADPATLDPIDPFTIFPTSAAFTVGSLWGGIRVTSLSLGAISATGSTRKTTLTLRVSTNRSSTTTTAETLGVQSYEHSFSIAFYPTPAGPTNLLNKCIGGEKDTSEAAGRANEQDSMLGALLARANALEAWRTGRFVTDYNSRQTQIADLQRRMAALETWRISAESRIVQYNDHIKNMPPICKDFTGDVNPPNDASWTGNIMRCEDNPTYPIRTNEGAYYCSQFGDEAHKRITPDRIDPITGLPIPGTGGFLQVRCTDSGLGNSNSGNVKWFMTCCDDPTKRVK